MRLLISLAFAVGLLAVASALTCKICDFRALSICITKSSLDTNCNGSCSIMKTSLGELHLYSKQQCTQNCKDVNKTRDSTFGIDYTVSCCNTDQCNSGTSAKLSLTLGLGMALLWLVKSL